MNAKETAKMRMAVQADYDRDIRKELGAILELPDDYEEKIHLRSRLPELQLDLPDLSDAEATSDEKETAKEDSKSSEPDHKGLGKSDQSDELQENCDDDDDYGVPFRLFEIRMIPVVFPFLPIENDGSCYEPPPSIIVYFNTVACLGESNARTNCGNLMLDRKVSDTMMQRRDSRIRR
ncbi:hypothetical protein L596_000500 [Steinernema carpocapsae]|uniref:Uncharacterized protein n=1 Tax=Steinernema carpocapsae TaxID=34508 RepID=A0A4U8UID4_STECR|nr:hypothetical protein L596_000500 [Steinernema carpocapsae]